MRNCWSRKAKKRAGRLNTWGTGNSREEVSIEPFKRVPTNSEVFLCGLWLRGKSNISKKRQNTKECMAFVPKLNRLNYLWKMHGHPQFSFWIPRGKFCFLRIVLNCAKMFLYWSVTTHRKPEYLEMSRTYAPSLRTNYLEIRRPLTKVGTVLKLAGTPNMHEECEKIRQPFYWTFSSLMCYYLDPSYTLMFITSISNQLSNYLS